MSRILTDVNVPEEYVSALRGDGHDVEYSREIAAPGPEATDDAIVAYAASEGMAIITTDVKGFADRDAAVPVFVAPQDMSQRCSTPRLGGTTANPPGCSR
ncbi:DUF5615 family PIN-like protein [Halorubrum ezzemoulense]|uniref:DUF5615 family PIN-like protein n=1 Tax=Halorubrum ezzemoulense TaxID=337243 RepID=UPI00232AD8F3|nr:DUF5615 family PIN-like protein [Halorubrum ezzemoulense]MDB9252984.1 DUF5615 family PIN-like protein [Halorubrum ezzemoulense]MDB9256631.1 DUF5615 family PIN-like protein [Halorubrum ezzemoulense]MDB9278038.1 DUF5615 family PIN-like protein [Halorubrum ezzemoulense]